MACVTPPGTPSIKVKSIGEEGPGFLTLSFSTDQLAQTEAQEVLLLAAAIITRRSGESRFQFRTVTAEGLVDGYSDRVRYFDIDAVIHPLGPGATGDPARKTYNAGNVIGFFEPKYLQFLPQRLKPLAAPAA